MDTSATIRHLQTLMGRLSPGEGPTSIPFLGMVSSAASHRLLSVSLPQSALFFILSGTKTIIHGENRIELKTGQGFLYPARMETIIENRPDRANGRYLALCLVYDEDMVGRVVSERSGPEIRPPLSLEALKTDCDALVGSSLNHLLHMAAASPDNKRLLSLCREELLLLMAERTDCLPLLWDAVSTWSSRCCRLIGMEPGRAWTAEAIAAKLGTSERSLRRHLNEENTSLRSLFREVRLNSGLAMLQTGTATVGETAYRCGYNSASRFAGLFRERFGVSPSQILQYNAVLDQPLAGS
ncbi:AraC family transcriptional regulator [Pseudodesulfovibrio sp. S3]|uniref:AraC family transcriptional regulator n=2 Tax=unclassified Pseudodesulfovibrio TaxID=2661612 RepID=UPI001005D0E2|nr:AraC family transcriptional regulator [Pseudodesulfovibrio sp. S3]MCJ2164299.1 AraC family transcriptional regulator [Pseudodesulfovibrio sp. S3-i]RWU04510.1 AraC family transcriptional regulator [Pseudodesulfovibrio sp. S3]